MQADCLSSTTSMWYEMYLRTLMRYEMYLRTLMWYEMYLRTLMWYEMYLRTLMRGLQVERLHTSPCRA